MRVVTGTPNDSIFIRALSGEELMLLIGWNTQMWSKSAPASKFSENLLTSLAGNAYSAYCIGPILITALALAGHVQQLSESINAGKRKRADSDKDKDEHLDDKSDSDDLISGSGSG